MRTKRNPRIPQNLEDFIHSINNTKSKNKANVSEMKNDKVVNQKVNVRKSGEINGEINRDKNMDKSGDREESIEVKEMNRSNGFVGNLNGDQFPPINTQVRSNDKDGHQDCLDQGIGDNGKGNVESDDEEGNDNEGKSRGVRNMKYAEIVNANKIDNKLMEISTGVIEDGNEVTYNKARYHLRRMWNKFGYLDLMKNDGGVVFFKFQDEKGMEEFIRGCVLSPAFCQRYCTAFYFCILVLRFAAAFWLCVLLIEDSLASLRFVSRLSCVLLQDLLRFVSGFIAFCLQACCEIVEITRKKMNDKMNDPECVTRKVKIATHDYSKENLLATFTPQKQLTPEQIFWSNDLMKLKSEALKEWTKAQTKEVKEMKDVFEELEAEVAQYAVDGKQVFSVATNSELNVARLTEMHVANTTVEARCLALEAELANLRDTNNHDNQKELINHFSKLEVNHLNLQLKYQNLKDSTGNNPPTPDKDTPDFDSFFVIGKMQASLQEKDNVIRQLKKQLSQMQVTRSDTDHTLRVHTTYSQITKLTDHVTHLQAQNDLFRAENDKIKQHYKELYDSIKITRAKHIEQVTKLTTRNVNLTTCVSKVTVNPQVFARDKHAIDVEPIVPRLRNNRDAHLDYLRHLKESVETICDIVEESKLVRPRDRSIVSTCRYTKHSQELLEYAIGTCPQGSQQQAKHLAYIPLIGKKVVVNQSDLVSHSAKANIQQAPVMTSTYKMADVNAPSGQTPAMAPPLRADDQILQHIRNLSNVVTNDLFQPWRALLTIINLCLTGKTSRFKRPRAPVLQILWGVVTRTNIDYAERIWEEFTQSIHTFIEDKRNLSRHTSGKKRATLIVIPSIQFTKLIIHHLQRRHRFHPRPDSPLHLPNKEPVLGYLKFSAKGTKREASYYQEYLTKVAQHRRYLAGETGGVQDPPAPKPTHPTRKPKTTAPKAPSRPSVSIPVRSAQPAPTSVPVKPQEKKRKQATETSDKPPKANKSKHCWVTKKRSQKNVEASKTEEVPTVEPQVADEDADYQKALEESMKDAYALPRGTLPPVVIREPESGKYQPFPEVPGKGKAKVTKEQVAHDLLSLQKHKKTSPMDQYMFQRRVSEPTGSSRHDESPYALLGQSNSEDESDKTGSDAGAQAEGQAGSNPDETSKGQAGSNLDKTSEGQAGPDLGDAEAKVQSITSHVAHAGSDREHMDLDVADVSPQPSTEQLDEGFTATAYPKVQKNMKLAIEEQVLLEEPASSSGTLSSLQHLSRDFSFGDQFFSDKPSEAYKNAETEVESMVNVSIQQALSSIPLQTLPIIDLSSRPESPKAHQQFKATTTDTTTTTTLPPPQAPQQSTTEAMMVKRIGELEHIMADLIQVNKDMKERLDSHGSRLHTLEQLDIPQQVSIVVSEVVTDAVDWAMQAPLRNRFRDLPEVDMKEILRQRMWESKSYKSHEDHMQLFEALKKSMNRDHSEELAQDLAEARKKKKKSRESPKTPPGSPSHQPPPPPPPAGPSGASGAPGASGSAQVPPSPPPSSSTNQESPSKGSAAPNLKMDEDMAPDEQAQSSNDEDIESAHVPTVNLRQCWWKTFEEERPATPEPACVDEPILRHNVSKPLQLGGPPSQVTIQSDFFFNKDLKYHRYGSKGRRPALSISKMKAAYYPDAGLEKMVPDQFWIDEE
uniref:RNA-directed DNA polymerase, eukaryota, reverse transcriptase zinc-binding domain protein n=1 Tax=Tanacetum cinerariifolium TaxID=118510 RepID=A0A6L2J8G9_TANCI|nr:RNA-directed DNA polymerase, eukaryota, reverse transcriptase zinc-binding domain protein [Tanacetum cinerariifolium]